MAKRKCRLKLGKNFLHKLSNPVLNPHHPGVFGAMGAAEDFIPGLHTVTDDLAIAVGAPGSKRLDGAFEAVKGMGLSIQDHLKRLVVFVAANFAIHTPLSTATPKPGVCEALTNGNRPFFASHRTRIALGMYSVCYFVKNFTNTLA